MDRRILLEPEMTSRTGAVNQDGLDAGEKEKSDSVKKALDYPGMSDYTED